MTGNQKKIGIAVVAAIICAVAFYFLYWIKTPVYSLGIIRDSIEKHDVATFEKHVDLDTLYNKGFDDALIAYGRLEGHDILSNPFAMGFIQMVKPTVISELKAKTLESVKGEDTAEQKKSMSSDMEIMAKNMKKKSGISNSTFKDASVISKENNVAIVAVKIHNEQLEKDFNLNVKMTKLDDGTWKVKELTNLVDFMMAVDKATKEKIAELNKPIREKMQSTLAVNDTEMKLGVEKAFIPYYWIDCKATLKNTGDKEITGFVAEYFVKDKDDRVVKKVMQPYGMKAIPSNGEITVERKINISKYNEDDKKIISSPDTYHISAEITSITFKDGTSLHMLNRLPEKADKKKK